MSVSPSRWRARVSSLFAAGALAAGLLATTSTPAQAAETSIDDATMTWGLSGYAQYGIFGPWTFKDLTGDATYLEGNPRSQVNPEPQTEYLVDPIPATSFPASNAGKSPNAVKFVGGEGTVDRTTGAAELEWEGSYTINAYPAIYNAPNEIYSDPILTVNPDGSGELTMDFTIGAGVSMGGEPFDEQNYGRLQMATFDAGSLSNKSHAGYRITPDFQGVEVDIPEPFSPQTRTCTTDGGATGWWGSWPTEFLDALGSHESGQSVMAHFYSTGCGGMQDYKPALPIDVGLPTDAGSVALSSDAFISGQSNAVTVTGTGFDPNYAVGTRPPFAGKRSGLYVAFGKFEDEWKASEGAPSGARKLASGANGTGKSVKWAVPADSFPGFPAQDLNSPSYVEFNEDGSFTAELEVNDEWIDSETGNWGIYTYAGGGSAVAEYETFTPITFAEPTGDGFVAMTPTRFLDTRTDNGDHNRPVAANGTVEVQIAGQNGVPADAAAVALNVTAVNGQGGFLTVHPSDVDAPQASNLNFNRNQTVANQVVSGLSEDGKISILASNTTDVIVDVTGYFGSATSYTSLTPKRLLDTRSAVGVTTTTPVEQGGVVDVTVAGDESGVPDDAVAVAVNLTSTQSAANGWITAYPKGEDRPTASTLNYGPNRNVAGFAVVKIGDERQISLFSSRKSHLLADVQGYFLAGGEYVGLTPERLVDTRIGDGAPKRQLGVGQTLTFKVAGEGGVPAEGASAAFLNITTVNSTKSGYFTVFPGGVERPTASTLNFDKGQTIANSVLARIGDDGTVSIYTTATSDVLVDVAGYVLDGNTAAE